MYCLPSGTSSAGRCRIPLHCAGARYRKSRSMIVNASIRGAVYGFLAGRFFKLSFLTARLPALAPRTHIQERKQWQQRFKQMCLRLLFRSFLKHITFSSLVEALEAVAGGSCESSGASCAGSAGGGASVASCAGSVGGDASAASSAGVPGKVSVERA